MNKEQARAFVQQTFTRSFDGGRFREFVVELLNGFDGAKAFTANSTYIKDAFKAYVERFERLGTYTSLEDEKLDVLVVHPTKGLKLEPARTADPQLRRRPSEETGRKISAAPPEK
jgi:hypothetical protein